MSIPALPPVRVQSGATEAEPGQTLFTANVQPGVQSRYFTDVDVLTAETGSQLLYRGDEGNFGDESWEGRMLPGGGAKAGDAGCSPQLSPGKSHGRVCCAALDSCIALFWEMIKIAALAWFSSASTKKPVLTVSRAAA